MPTPTRSFLDVAARYGNVDTSDLEAVQHWFTEVLPTLPPDTIDEILEVLLENEGSAAGGGAERIYPKGVPLPSLSTSPPAPIPILAFRLRELIRLMRRNKK